MRIGRFIIHQFNQPLVYTPGDNGWTDCHKKEASAYDPEERLQVIRNMFFKDSSGFGRTRMPLISESSVPGYEKFVENKRWTYRKVTFATLHVVGSNNYLNVESRDSNREFYERDKANVYWLKEVFARAVQEQSPGIVLFIHADMFMTSGEISGFAGESLILITA